jgi:hypothetical protein
VEWIKRELKNYAMAQTTCELVGMMMMRLALECLGLRRFCCKQTEEFSHFIQEQHRQGLSGDQLTFIFRLRYFVT